MSDLTSNPRALVENLVGYVTTTSDRIGFAKALQAIELALMKADEPAAALCVDPAFEGSRCPFTKLPYFMHLEHPELGRVPTYGGPYDSYTIPIPDDDNERTLRSERYDHDEGAWIEGGEPWPMNIVTNEEFVDLHTLREERAAEPPTDDLNEATRLLHIVYAWYWRPANEADSARVDSLYPARGPSSNKTPLFTAIGALLDRHPYGGAGSQPVDWSEVAHVDAKEVRRDSILYETKTPADSSEGLVTPPPGFVRSFSGGDEYFSEFHLNPDGDGDPRED